MSLNLRPMQSDEVSQLVTLASSTGFFRKEEVEIAREVLTEAAAKGETSGYRVLVAADGDRPAGFVCFGQTPMTRGTWDVYWIAVDLQQHRRGVGSRLMRLAEQEIVRRNGRLILVETSSQDLYEPTRQFYLARGYREVSRIADFYETGDAKVTYAKSIGDAGTEPPPP